MTDDDDVGDGSTRAAARTGRYEDIADGLDSAFGRDQHRYQAAVGRLVLVVLLLPAHIVAVQAATPWLAAHLVLVAILASQATKRWLAHRHGLRAGGR